ncbi:MAG: hypothetical protein ACLQFR_31035 [Streptosporangiaceae bacterium]
MLTETELVRPDGRRAALEACLATSKFDPEALDWLREQAGRTP